VPPEMSDPPERIAASYRQAARELDLPWRTIEEAGKATMRFLNPLEGPCESNKGEVELTTLEVGLAKCRLREKCQTLSLRFVSNRLREALASRRMNSYICRCNLQLRPYV
jgi:hypothetical protein